MPTPPPPWKLHQHRDILWSLCPIWGRGWGKRFYQAVEKIPLKENLASQAHTNSSPELLADLCCTYGFSQRIPGAPPSPKVRSGFCCVLEGSPHLHPNSWVPPNRTGLVWLGELSESEPENSLSLGNVQGKARRAQLLKVSSSGGNLLEVLQGTMRALGTPQPLELPVGKLGRD